MQKIDENALLVRYLEQQAPIMYLVLAADGTIQWMNRHAAKVLGEQLIGKGFRDLFLEFHQNLSLDQMLEHPDSSHVLSFASCKGSIHSYHFFGWRLDDRILVCGHEDVEEIESLSQELLETNQELNNLMRKLNVKNRELERANARITELTRTDPLTQLANRRYFQERIQEMVSLSERKSEPLSLIMTDIDTFKAVNDTFGHDAGDRVLKGFAGLMKSMVRNEDLPARFGGEEFIIVLPLTNSRQAYTLAERIRCALQEKDFLENRHQITASFGVSQLEPGESQDSCIKRADMALYLAKDAGRNQTVVAVIHSNMV